MWSYVRSCAGEAGVPATPEGQDTALETHIANGTDDKGPGSGTRPANNKPRSVKTPLQKESLEQAYLSTRSLVSALGGGSCSRLFNTYVLGSIYITMALSHSYVRLRDLACCSQQISQ